MYEDFYGLRERAFVLTADPRFLLLTAGLRESLSLIQYTLKGQAGLMLLVGEPGAGKTTLLRAAVDAVRRDVDRFVILDNPILTRAEFFEFLARDFGLGRDAEGSKTRTLLELRQALINRHRRGGRSALIVDEAQGLPDELLEEIRLLVNLESRGEKLLPTVLSGHRELADRLNDPLLGPLKQRIELRSQLAPLSLPETADYVAGRLRLAGGDIAETFTRPAVEAIFHGSLGSPGAIGVICENALVTGVALAARPVDRDVVIEACRDLDLGPATFPAEAPSRAPHRETTASGARAEPGDEPARPAGPAPVTAAGGAATGEPAEARERAGIPAAVSGPATATPPPRPAASGVEEAPAAEAPAAEASPATDAAVRDPAPPMGASAPGDVSPSPRRRRPAVGALLGRMVDLLPSSRPRERGPVRLQVQHFQVGGRRGIVVTPAGRGR